MGSGSDSTLDQLAAMDSVLTNPYDLAGRQLRRGFEERGLIPRSDAKPEQWVAWWQQLPQVLQDKKSRLVLLVAGSTRDGFSNDSAERNASRTMDADGTESMPELDLAARHGQVCQALDSLVGDTPAMRQVRRDTWAAAFGENLAAVLGRAPLIHTTPVRIQGETGTGKELVGQAIGKAAPSRWDAKTRRWIPAPFEAINLASVPADLVAGTLFGHEKGAYSAAYKSRVGILAQCHEGVVFLDEIAELPLPTQVALLRCLQEGKVRPLGAPHDVSAQPRIVSATHQPLRTLVDQGKFRRDLYHRLSAVTITLPPLRERRSDIRILAEHMLNEVEPMERTMLLERVNAWLQRVPENYRWPGNVRELGLAVKVLGLGLVPRLEDGDTFSQSDIAPQSLLDGEWSLDQVKRWYAERVLQQCNNQTHAAQRLGIDRNTLKKLVKSHGN